MARTEVRGEQIKDASVSLTADVTGTLPAANGGTGNATNTLNAALLGNGTGALQTVAPGTADNVLLSDGTTWASSDKKQNIVKSGLAKIDAGATLWSIPGTGLVSSTTSALSVNQVRYTPFVVSYPITITNWQFEVTTGPSGSSNVRVGIYAADTDLQPSGAPLYDSGAISVASAFTGLKNASGLSVALTPGMHLAALNCSVALTLRALISATAIVVDAMGSNPLVARMSVAQTFAAFPNPGTKWTATTNTGSTGMGHSAVFKWTE